MITLISIHLIYYYFSDAKLYRIFGEKFVERANIVLLRGPEAVRSVERKDGLSS
jgi:hypothetical protein